MGRRPLALISLFLLTLGLFGLGGFFYLARSTSYPVTYTDASCHSQPALVWNGITTNCFDCSLLANCGYCHDMCVSGTAQGPLEPNICTVNSTSTTQEEQWIYSNCPNNFAYLSVIIMVYYLLAYGSGMGGLPWTINAEIYKPKFRSLAVSLSTATSWMGNVLVSSTFLTISSPNGLMPYGAFWMYGTISLLGFFWLYCVLPETKGLPLEKVELLFRRESDKEEEDVVKESNDEGTALVQ